MTENDEKQMSRFTVTIVMSLSEALDRGCGQLEAHLPYSQELHKHMCAFPTRQARIEDGFIRLKETALDQQEDVARKKGLTRRLHGLAGFRHSCG